MYTDGTIALTPFEREDLPRVLAWVNDPELCRAVDRVLPVTALEHARWYESLITRTDAVTFAIRFETETIGLCGLKAIHPRSRNAELWIYLGDETRRGQGLGRRAVELLTRFGFDQMNLHRIHLHVADYNTAACRLYLSCGFQEEGRDREHIYIDGKYHDAIRMGLLRTERRVDAPASADRHDVCASSTLTATGEMVQAGIP